MRRERSLFGDDDVGRRERDSDGPPVAALWWAVGDGEAVEGSLSRGDNTLAVAGVEGATLSVVVVAAVAVNELDGETDAEAPTTPNCESPAKASATEPGGKSSFNPANETQPLPAAAPRPPRPPPLSSASCLLSVWVFNPLSRGFLPGMADLPVVGRRVSHQTVEQPTN